MPKLKLAQKWEEISDFLSVSFNQECDEKSREFVHITNLADLSDYNTLVLLLRQRLACREKKDLLTLFFRSSNLDSDVSYTTSCCDSKQITPNTAGWAFFEAFWLRTIEFVCGLQKEKKT